jgi:hypothetical protein
MSSERRDVGGFGVAGPDAAAQWMGLARLSKRRTVTPTGVALYPFVLFRFDLRAYSQQSAQPLHTRMVA